MQYEFTLVLHLLTLKVKGLVSRKFDMLLLVPLDRYKFSTPFLLYLFLKISSLSCRIFYCKMFRGGFYKVPILLMNCATYIRKFFMKL
jgi:hypothetical protein